MFELYLVTNRVNSKRYVGQTTQGYLRRWSQHISDRRKGPLYHAIRKYGPTSFAVELLETVEDQAALNAAEIATIARLGTTVPNGYNATLGGEGGRDTEATRQKKSATWLTPERRRQNSEAQKKAWEVRHQTFVPKPPKPKGPTIQEKKAALRIVPDEIRQQMKTAISGLLDF